MKQNKIIERERSNVKLLCQEGAVNISRADDEKEEEKFIYLDQGIPTSKKTIELKISLNGDPARTILLFADKSESMTYLSRRIGEEFEKFTIFNGLMGLKAINIHKKEKDKMISIPNRGNSEIANHLKDYDQLFCDLISTDLWIGIQFYLSSSVKNLEGRLEMKVDRNCPITLFKKHIQRFILYMWNRSCNEDELYYYVLSKISLKSTSEKNINSTEIVFDTDQLGVSLKEENCSISDFFNFGAKAIIYGYFDTLEEHLEKNIETVLEKIQENEPEKTEKTEKTDFNQTAVGNTIRHNLLMMNSFSVKPRQHYSFGDNESSQLEFEYYESNSEIQEESKTFNKFAQPRFVVKLGFVLVLSSDPSEDTSSFEDPNKSKFHTIFHSNTNEDGDYDEYDGKDSFSSDRYSSSVSLKSPTRRKVHKSIHQKGFFSKFGFKTQRFSIASKKINLSSLASSSFSKLPQTDKIKKIKSIPYEQAISLAIIDDFILSREELEVIHFLPMRSVQCNFATSITVDSDSENVTQHSNKHRKNNKRKRRRRIIKWVIIVVSIVAAIAIVIIIVSV